MKQKIVSAFEHRQRPVIVTTVAVNSTLREDALHFQGLDWTQITASDWANWSDAYYGLSPDAFLYFLPSILVLSLEHSNLPLAAADALAMSLDTSANPDIWDDWFRSRFSRLTLAELATLKEWAAAHLADHERGEGSEFARVQDTLEMLLLAAEG